MIVIHKPWTRQPTGLISIRKTGLTSDALHWWLLHPRTGYRDLVGTANGTATSITPIVTQYGVAANYTSGSSAINVGDPSDINFGTGQCTIGIRFLARSTASRMMLLGKDDASLGRQFHVQINSGSAGEVNITSGINPSVTTSGGVVQAGRLHNVIYVRDSSLHRIYIDGVESATSGSSTSISDTSAPLLLGARSYSGFEDPLDGYIEQAFFLNRAWSPHDVKIYNNSPYQVFAGGPKIVLPHSAGVIAPTLVSASAINLTSTSFRPRVTFTR